MYTIIPIIPPYQRLKNFFISPQLFSPQSSMPAQEERSYRTLSRKTVEAEERSSLLKNLVKMKVGFREVEEFINNEKNKLKPAV